MNIQERGIQKVTKGDDPMPIDQFVGVCQRVIADTLTLRAEAIKLGLPVEDPTAILLLADRIVAAASLNAAPAEAPKEAPKTSAKLLGMSEPKKTQKQRIMEIMGRSTMSARDVAKALGKNGPWSKAKNPMAVLNTLFSVSEEFQRVSTGKYRVRRDLLPKTA